MCLCFTKLCQERSEQNDHLCSLIPSLAWCSPVYRRHIGTVWWWSSAPEGTLQGTAYTTPGGPRPAPRWDGTEPWSSSPPPSCKTKRKTGGDDTVNEAKRIMESLRTPRDATSSGATSSSGAGTIHVYTQTLMARPPGAVPGSVSHLTMLKTADDMKSLSITINNLRATNVLYEHGSMNMGWKCISRQVCCVQNGSGSLHECLCAQFYSRPHVFWQWEGKKVKCSSKAPKTPVAISYLSSLWNFHSGCNNTPPPPPSLHVIAGLLWESERVILGCLVSFSSSSASESKEHPLGCLQEVVLYTQCRHCQSRPHPPTLGLLSNHLKEGFGNREGALMRGREIQQKGRNGCSMQSLVMERATACLQTDRRRMVSGRGQVQKFTWSQTCVLSTCATGGWGGNEAVSFGLIAPQCLSSQQL